jgi:IS1 family transposase
MSYTVWYSETDHHVWAKKKVAFNVGGWNLWYRHFWDRMPPPGPVSFERRHRISVAAN